MSKMVKPSEKLHIGVALNTCNPQEYNVRYEGGNGEIYCRTTNDTEMRLIAERILENKLSGFNVQETSQNRLINWVTENIPGTTYHVTIELYSENKPYKGNMQEYYLKGLRGEVVSFGGPVMKKLYVSRKSAINAAKRVKEIYPNAVVRVHETNIHFGKLGTLLTLDD